MASKCRLGMKLRISVALIVVTCLCLKQVKGSCLSYGHSCWGAHGKRAGPPGRAAPGDGPGMVQYKPQQLLDQSNPLPVALTATERWALVRVLPEKNAYYPVSKRMHSPPPPPPPVAASLLFNDDLSSSVSDASRTAVDSVNGPVRRLADTSNDSKTLASTEQDLAVGDDRYPAPDGSYPNAHRRDLRHKKKPQTATQANHRYGGFDDSYEENAPTDDDMSQLLLLNAVAAAAMADNDAAAAGPLFNRKLFGARNSVPLNA